MEKNSSEMLLILKRVEKLNNHFKVHDDDDEGDGGRRNKTLWMNAIQSRRFA